MYDKLIAQLKINEGVRYKPYKCTAGKLTIGVGRNIQQLGISEDESDYLLSNDIHRVQDELANNVNIYCDLSDARKAALIDMCFNLGIGRFKRFKKFLKALNDEMYLLASKEMLNSKWAKQVGNRAKRLAEQIRTGEWQCCI